MKVLLKHYKEKTSLSYCPLCNATDYGCNGCPWILFGYKSDYSNNDYACEEWMEKYYEGDETYHSIKLVRSYPKEYNILRKKRIGMLVQWIRNSEVV